MDFIDFRVEHFPEYRGWFSDELLLSALGPAPDQEWLEFVLSDNTGRQYVVSQHGRLIAVVGITFVPDAPDMGIITDLAVNPESRGKGFGSRILGELERVLECDKLRAFVDQQNPAALAFFKKNRWTLSSEEPDNDGLFQFQSPDRHSNT